MTLPLDELVENPQWVNERAQACEWDDLLFEYEKALDDIQAWLRGLNDGQVRFKPEPRSFSIAEAVTHNIFSDEMFWNWAKLLAYGRGSEIDPKLLISGAGARNDLSLAALEALSEACRSLARSVMNALPEHCDLNSTVPHPHFGELNAKGWVYFMCVHHGLHLRQCERVIDFPSFPRSTGLQSQPRDVYQSSARKVWLTAETKSKSRSTRTTSTRRKSTTSTKPKTRQTTSKKKSQTVSKSKPRSRAGTSRATGQKRSKASRK
jgi:hypothetical protein